MSTLMRMIGVRVYISQVPTITNFSFTYPQMNSRVHQQSQVALTRLGWVGTAYQMTRTRGQRLKIPHRHLSLSLSRSSHRHPYRQLFLHQLGRPQGRFPLRRHDPRVSQRFRPLQVLVERRWLPLQRVSAQRHLLLLPHRRRALPE